jgi:tetratricopeptide (TPR) repeat protein
MAQSPASKSVQGGIPLWIWVVLIGLGGALAIGLIIQLTPSDPMLHFDKAVQAFNEKNSELLLEEIEKFNEFDGYESEKRLLEGMKWIAESRPLKAIPLLKEAMAEKTTRLAAMTALGRAYRNAAEIGPAVEILEQVIAEDPDNIDAQTMLVNIYHDLGLIEKTIRMAETLIEKNQSLQAAYRARGEMYKRLGKFSEAAKDLETAVDSEANNFMTPVIGMSMLQCLIKAEDFEEAARFLEMADPGPPRELMQAQILLGRGQAEESYETVRKIIGEVSGEPIVYVTIGRAILEAKPARAQEAIDMILRELFYMNRNEDLYAVLADLSVAVGDEEKAELYRQNRDKLAEIKATYYARINEQDPSLMDPQWHLETGDLAAELRDFESARYWYDAARRLDASLANAIGERMEVLYKPREELVPTMPPDAAAGDDDASATAADQKQDGGAESPEGSRTEESSDKDPDDGQQSEGSGADATATESSDKKTPPPSEDK